MNFTNVLFSFNGRISRKPFWLGLLAVALVQIVLSAVLTVLTMSSANEGVSMGTILIGLVMAVMLYPVLAIHAKRWHDRDCTGWKALTLIQGIGGLWDLVEVSFMRGTPGPNRFGPDPLAPALQPNYARPLAA
jgi:uncharacterized membrane protein YhaH (DUF805 family)